MEFATIFSTLAALLAGGCVLAVWRLASLSAPARVTNELTHLRAEVRELSMKLADQVVDQAAWVTRIEGLVESMDDLYERVKRTRSAKAGARGGRPAAGAAAEPEATDREAWMQVARERGLLS